MALDTKDLANIEAIMATLILPVQQDIRALRKDINEMRQDVAILAKLNQLDAIKQDARLRVLYKADEA